MTLGVRKLVAGLALLGLLAICFFPERVADWFRFVLALVGVVK